MVRSTVRGNVRGWTGGWREAYLLPEQRPNTDTRSQFIVIDGGYALALGALKKMNEAGEA